MKKFAIIVVSFLVLSFAAKAQQDTIYTKNGRAIGAKVIEINQTEVKYKKAANPDGPVYTTEKSAIVFIQYKNGTKDIFGEDSNSQTAVNSAPQSNNGNPSPRPRVNVIVAPPPVYVGPSYSYGWGWRRPYYYRPYPHYYHHHGWH